MADLLSAFFGLLGDIFGKGFAGILIAAAIAALVAGWLTAAAIRSAGPDRTRIINWLEHGVLRAGYIWLLERTLNWLDRRMGDADKPESSWPSPIGNRRPAPFWTGQALDTCALLALAYPLLSIFVVWAVAGDVGPVGELLLLSDIEGDARAFTVAAVFLVFFLMMQSRRTLGWRSLAWRASALACAVAFLVADAFARTGGLVAVAGVFTVVFAGSGRGSGVGAGAVAGAFAVAFAVAVAGFGPFADADAVGVAVARAVAGTVFVAIIVAVAATIAGVMRLADDAKTANRMGRFWTWFGPLALLAASAGLTASVAADAPPTLWTLIFILSVLPLVNLPFDFASLGLTRALLRRGCEADAPSPFLLGVIDVLLAAILLLLLAAALVVAVQAADAIAWRLKATTFLNVAAVLDQIGDNPRDPANWWIYFLLFSTLIPSALNAVIGTFSLLSWSLPSLRRWLLETLRTVEADKRGWRGRGMTRNLFLLAIGLQVFATIVLTALTTWALFEGLNNLLPFALPRFLDALRWLAATSGGWFGLPPVP